VLHEIAEGGHRFRFGCPECGRRFAHHRPLPVGSVQEFIVGPAPDVYFFDRPSVSAVVLAEAYRKLGSLVVFEPSTLGRIQYFSRAVQSAHIVKYSRERRRVFQSALESPPQEQVRIETLGDEGLRLRFGERPWRTQSGFKVGVSDAGGAGDWTTAGLLSALPNIHPSELLADESAFCEALRFGQALAAANCAFLGARGLAGEPLASVLERAAVIRNARSALAEPGRKLVAAARRASSCAACLASI